MVPWYWVIISLIGGVFVGWMFCSLMWAADEAERNQPRPGERRYIK